MKTLFFAFLAIVGFVVGTATARAAPITFEWDPPTTDCAGNALALEDIGGYFLFITSESVNGPADPCEGGASDPATWKRSIKMFALASVVNTFSFDPGAAGMVTGNTYYMHLRSMRSASECQSNPGSCFSQPSSEIQFSVPIPGPNPPAVICP